MARKSRKNTVIPTENTNLLPTAFYIRLSVENNKRNSDSIQTQSQILEDYLATMPELTLFQKYIDNGESGSNINRPAFQQMISDMEQGKIRCLLIRDLSRLGRNSLDTGYFMEKFFPLHNIRLISVSDSYDSWKDLGSALAKLLPVKNLIHEAYAKDIGRKIKAQQRQFMKEGKYVGARAPYGFEKAESDCHKLVVDRVTAPIVEKIFSLYLEGLGLSAICRQLNEENIPTPSHYARLTGKVKHENLVGNGAWQTHTIKKILTNETYVGDLVQGKTEYQNKEIPEQNNLIIVKNTHEAIISREIFHETQEVMAERKHDYRGKNTENIYRGKIFCGCCGGHLHRQKAKRVKGDKYFFHCIANQRIAKGTCIGTARIDEKVLEEQIYEKLINSGWPYEKGKYFRTEFQVKVEEKLADFDGKIQVSGEKVAEYKKLLSSLYENYALELISLEEYQEMKLDYQKKLDSEIKLQEEILLEKEAFRKERERFFQIRSALEVMEATLTLTHEVVHDLIDHIKVTKEGCVLVETVNTEFCW